MRYRIEHRTTYRYSQPVAISHNVLHLAPRPTLRQTVVAHNLDIEPMASARTSVMDWFGNHVVHVTVQEPHTTLTITATSEVEVVAPQPIAVAASRPWEVVVAALEAPLPDAALREAVEFRFASPRVPLSEDFAALARPSFPAGRPLLAAAVDLTERIHREFTYDAKATDVETPVAEVLALKRGVCQDFAHLMIAALRSLGLAARYVSGYLETRPPPGQARLVGADASHAWVQIHDPVLGWIDLDPTNGVVVAERHITVAWGRDVGDVSPTKGMILGGGQHSVEVAVDVAPLTP